MKTIIPAQTPEQLLKEANGYFGLGLLEEVEKRVIQYEESSGLDSHVISLRKELMSARGDYPASAKLARDDFKNSRSQLDDLHFVNAAGDPAWAYAKSIQIPGIVREPLYWFNLACFASQIGKFRDAVASLLVTFRISERFLSDAFFDPDLESLWPWMKAVVLDDTLAERLAHWAWPEVAEVAESSKNELTLTPLMRDRVPEVFRQYIPCGSQMNGLYANPSMPSDLFHAYLAWQRETIAPRVRLLREMHQRATHHLCKRQLRFAFWQASHGNLTAARYHILHYLARFPEHLPRLDFLRKYGMGCFLDDLAPAIHEDSQFAEKMNSFAHQVENTERSREILDEIGPEGCRSTIFKFRLAHWHLRTDRTDDGIRLLIDVIKAWPDDAAAYSRLTDAFITSERWEEARLSFRAAPAHGQTFRHFMDQWHQIKEEDKAMKAPEAPSGDFFYGQRSLGGNLRREHYFSEGPAPKSTHRRVDAFSPET